VSHDVDSGAAESDVALGLRAGKQLHFGTPDPGELRRLFQ
jgi:hypothetical protein